GQPAARERDYGRTTRPASKKSKVDLWTPSSIRRVMSDSAMKHLAAKAWLALAGLGVVMGLLLFVPAGTVHYWQAWVYVSIFTGASVLTTIYLLRKDRVLLARRMSGGPTAEKGPAEKTLMLCR